MDKDTAIAMVQQRLGNRTDLALAIAAEMEEVQRDVLETASVKFWFQITRELFTTPLETVAGQTFITLPTNFLQEVDGAPVQIQCGDSWLNLEKDDYGALTQFYGMRSGTPERYAILDNVFELFPSPDLTYPLRFIYYGRGDSLATSNTNVWLTNASVWFVDAVTAVMAAKYLLNMELASVFESSANAARQRLYIANEARRQSNAVLAMGDD